jgi:hypothetical protein
VTIDTPAPDVEDTWRPDGKGILPNGDCGGDAQATESHSVRYVRSDGRRMVTVSAYGVSTPSGRYAVETETETLVCEDPADPGGTEVWSDAAYQTGAPVWATPDEAENAALGVARNHSPASITWDGRAPWEPQRPPPSGEPKPTEPPSPRPRAGSTTSSTIGDTSMTAATGEAQTFEQMLAQIRQIEADAKSVLDPLRQIAQAAENLDAAAKARGLDDHTRAALNKIATQAHEAAQLTEQIPPLAKSAETTFQQQQGGLAEAHAAQPQAAERRFYAG